MGSESERTSTGSDQSQQRLESHKKSITDYKEYQYFLYDIDKSKALYIFYTSTESPNSGYSWCPICIEAMHVLEKYLASQLYDSVFLVVNVGSQEEWEDKTNPYRTDKNLNLRVVPTVMKYRTPKRLEGQYCLKTELLDLIFEEECEF